MSGPGAPGAPGGAEPAAARTVVVTGASSGIGAATGRALGALGWRVALGGRRTDRLEETAKAVEAAGGRALARSLDVRDAGSIDAFFDALEDAWGPAEVLVNNAGVGIPQLLREAEAGPLEDELRTNLLGPILAARRVLPAMVERGAGDVVFVSSLNAVEPRTFQGGYTASKAGLEGAARVLAMELEGTGVRSTIVRPGPTGSEFGSGYGGELARRILTSWQYWGVMRQLHWMPAESVARAVVAVVTAPAGTSFDLLQVTPRSPEPGAL